MNLRFIVRAAWHGISQAVVTGGGILIALNHWPTDYEIMVVAVSTAIALVKGVDGFRVEP